MDNILLLLAEYKYLLLFPLAVLEGPIVTVIAGFFVTTGFFNPYFVYIVVASGDIVGDSFYYFLGRGGGILFRKIFKNKINPEKIEQARAYFSANQKKALILSKVIHGIGVSGLVAAGSLKIPYKKYMMICGVTSIVQSAILLAVGVVFGHAYIKLGKYFDYWGIFTTLVIAVIVIFLIFKYKYKVKRK